ncbi:MAG: hypothetical protein HY208_01530 [Nitrospirae bacterium]|nr:hypothetical protein [Nitrospirota bacterium]
MEQSASSVLQAPPDALTVFRRAHSLGALVQRWEFEQTIQGFDEMSIVEIHKGMASDLGKWLEREGLHTFLSESERGLVVMPLGHWQTDLVEAVGWRLEPLGIFAWALSLIKTLPPYDRRFSQDDLLMRLKIGKPLQPPATLHLRSAGELQAAHRTARLWEWRAQAAQRPMGADQPDPMNPDGHPTSIAAQAAGAWKEGLLPEPIGEDFPAFGRAYASLSRQQIDLLAAIAEQRAAALGWLCGQ